MRFTSEDAASTAFGVVAAGAYAGYLAFGGTPFIKHVESEAVFRYSSCRSSLNGPAAPSWRTGRGHPRHVGVSH
jgi:hypothetical protein